MNRVLLIFLLAATTLSAGDWEPLTDLPAAIERARVGKKLVFVEFTGSDWCLPCIRFEQQVMRDAVFVEFAARRFVPVRLDIPYRAKIDPELKQRNEALVEKHGVKIFPTFLILDGHGRELGRREGYLGEPAGEFVKLIKTLIRRLGKQPRP